MSEKLPPELLEEINGLLAQGLKIEAIKIYREATGKGLKDSKDVIDKLCEELVAREPQKYSALAANQSGCFSSIFLFLFLLLTGFQRFL